VARIKLAEAEYKAARGQAGPSIGKPSRTRFEDFVEQRYRPAFLDPQLRPPRLTPSTRRSTTMHLDYHLLPHFGRMRLRRITHQEIRRFILDKSQQQRHSYSRTNPNPHRPLYSRKTLINIAGTLSAVLQHAVNEGDLAENPVRGMDWRHLLHHLRGPQNRERYAILPFDDYRRAVEILPPWVMRLVLVATFAGGRRWGELIALRIDEDVDPDRRQLYVTKTLWRRQAGRPKTVKSARATDMTPLVMAIVRACPHTTGLVFSPDGVTPIGDGSYVKRIWRAAQLAVGIRPDRCIPWKGLRNMFVSLNVAAGKPMHWVTAQVGHEDISTTARVYHYFFNTMPSKPGAEYAEELIWPDWRRSTALRQAIEDAPWRPEECLKSVLVSNTLRRFMAHRGSWSRMSELRARPCETSDSGLTRSEADRGGMVEAAGIEPAS
jgi:integrase